MVSTSTIVKSSSCSNDIESGFVLKAENLYKFYKDGKISLEVLKGISLEIRKGEILCVIGPSGAGKSTLLHLLGGLDEPSKGKVIFEGRDLYRIPERQRAQIRNKKIGFVFQFYHLLSEFSALENVMLPALINRMGLKQAREKAVELLTAVGLEARISHKPGQLSGGEQQRVAIARTLINDPDLIFCDEPTGNLDSQRGEQIAGLLYELNQHKRKTLIIVSHEKSIAKMADRIINIRDGKII
ncbi:MAG: ABC transporter ATP-binding protein [Candidatus Omnitrophica bacterium]|nr:ABC transporter ATP-binding protein [Candidatus Omnitrophota bacterium]